MKRALVTGSLGFVGRSMVKELRTRGWMVHEFDIKDLTMYGDCRSELLHERFDEFDLVVHAAYHVGGRAAIDGINHNFAKNIELDGLLFSAMLRHPPRRVLYFSSSAAYPVKYQTWERVRAGTRICKKGLRESHINFDDPELPDGNYGWAKLTGEMLARDAQRNGLNVTVVRPFSGYSEFQDLAYPFPAIMNRAMNGEYQVWGPMGQTRDWIHVDDVVSACFAIMESEHEGPVNICTGRPVTMGDVMRMAANALHKENPVIYPPGQELSVQHLPEKPTGVFYRLGNPELMKTFYVPKIDLEEGLTRAARSLMFSR